MRHAATRALFERLDVSSSPPSRALRPWRAGRLRRRHGGSKGLIGRRDTVLRHLVDIQYERTNIDLVRASSADGEQLEVSRRMRACRPRGVFGDDVERINEPIRSPGGAGRSVTASTSIRRATSCAREKLTRRPGHRGELVDRVKELEDKGRLPQRSAFAAQRTRSRDDARDRQLRRNREHSRHLARRPAEAGRGRCSLLPPDYLISSTSRTSASRRCTACNGGDRRARRSCRVRIRLPSALENRPLTFDEFEARLDQTIYVSATPSAYEIRAQARSSTDHPTDGLIDPEIEVRRTTVRSTTCSTSPARSKRGQRALVTTSRRRCRGLRITCARWA